MNKRRLIIGGILIGVLVIAVGAGIIYFSTNRGAREELLTQLEIETGPATDELLASGFIEAEEVEIAAELGGRIVELPFEEGDEVSAGDVLVRLDPTLLEAQRAAAQAQLNMAIAQRNMIRAGVREEILRQAQAQVAIAQASLEGAQVALNDAVALRNNPQDIEVQVAEAQTQLAVAQQQLAAAQVGLQSAERSRQLYYDSVNQLESLIERFDWTWEGAPQPPSVGLDLALSPRRYDEAEANMRAAQESVEGTQELLNALQDLANDPQALQAQVIEAQTAFETAQASLKRAEAELANLEAGPSEEDLAVADAQVQEAQAALDAVNAQIERLTLTAPINGVILEQPLHVSELAVPGVPIVTLANLDVVELTVYVTATQLDRVALNQEVSISVDSFPDRTFEGVIVHIADEAEFTPRSVQTQEERVNLVFAVKIRIENPDHALKPGMPADAHIRS